MYQLKQSSTARPLLFLMVLSSDHITPRTGATPTVTIRKNNGSPFAAPAGAVTEVGNGWYQVAGNATDTNTLGPLLLHATASAADPVDREYEVVAHNPDTDIALVKVKTDQLGATDVTVVSPMKDDGSYDFETRRGDTYQVGSPKGAIVWTESTGKWSQYVGKVAGFKAVRGEQTPITRTVTFAVVSGSIVSATMELVTADTSGLKDEQLGNWVFDVEVTMDATEKDTALAGVWSILPDVPR